MNKVILLGNLTRDPEMRTLTSGSSVTSFSLAVNRKFKTKDGGAKEEVLFVDCSVWGAAAEPCSKYLSKGSKTLVEGRLRTETWEDKEGNKRSKLSVVCDNVEFLDSATKSDEPAKKNRPTAKKTFDEEVEDSPF